jgi:hypothetical protein
MLCFNCYINNNYTIIIILSDATAYTRQGLTINLHGVTYKSNQFERWAQLLLSNGCKIYSYLLTYLTPWSVSASELYRMSNRHLSAKLMQTFGDRRCQVVSVTDPCGHILGFLDRNRYFFSQVALQLLTSRNRNAIHGIKGAASGQRTTQLMHSILTYSHQVLHIC